MILRYLFQRIGLRIRGVAASHTKGEARYVDRKRACPLVTSGRWVREVVRPSRRVACSAEENIGG